MKVSKVSSLKVLQFLSYIEFNLEESKKTFLFMFIFNYDVILEQ